MVSNFALIQSSKHLNLSPSFETTFSLIHSPYPLCFQIAQGVVPPHISFCSYALLSVPTIWRLVLEDDFDKNTPLGIFEVIQDRTDNLQTMAANLCTDTHCTLDAFENKLYSIVEPLGSKTLGFTLFRNIQSMSFEEIFDEIGPGHSDTIRYCSNAGQPCGNLTRFHSGQFASCFDYASEENGGISKTSGRAPLKCIYEALVVPYPFFIWYDTN